MLILKKTNNIDLIHNVDIQCFNNSAYSIYQYRQMLNYHDFYIIEDDNEIIGFIILLKIDSDYEIIKIGVIGKHRNKSYAYKSLLYLLDNLEFKKMFLEVSSNNLIAIKLYKKLNFKQIAIRKQYYNDKSNALIFCYEKL